MGVKRFEDLRVWQEARALADDPKLRSQLGAAVASIMSNIAEGFIRRRRREFTQFLRVAAGSTAETRSLLYVLESRDAITHQERERLAERTESIGRMLRRLMDYLESPPLPNPNQEPRTNEEPRTKDGPRTKH
jgi:four helix bundle protein